MSVGNRFPGGRRFHHLPRVSCLAAVGLILSGIPALAQQDPELSSEERITIRDRGGVIKIRLLLEEFLRGPGATDDDTRAVFKVVGDDLDFSDLFSIVTIPRMSGSDTLNAVREQALVRGELSVSGGELVLRGSLETLPGRSLIFSKDYRTRPEWYRQAAHQFADDIVLHLTGNQGIARTRIAFVSDRSGSKEVWVVDYDGQGLRQVTRDATLKLSPDWAPDGSALAYVSYERGDPDIYVMDLESGVSRLLIGGLGVQGSPAFSPDGGTAVFNQTSGRDSDLYTCDREGRNLRRITHSVGINTAPAWSPDGRRLVFTSDRSGNPQLYMAEADGTGSRRITFEGKWNDLAHWSPAGDRIAYTSRRGGLFRIAVIDAGGRGGEEQITRGPGSDEHPDWAPDGRHLVFTSTRGGEKGLYVLDVDSGRIRPLVVGRGNHAAPTWSPPAAR